jgi:hypothetical protein
MNFARRRAPISRIIIAEYAFLQIIWSIMGSEFDARRWVKSQPTGPLKSQANMDIGPSFETTEKVVKGRIGV